MKICWLWCELKLLLADIARSVGLSEEVTRVSQHFGALTIDSADALVKRDQQMGKERFAADRLLLISSIDLGESAGEVEELIQPSFLTFLVALDSLRLALSIDASLEDRSDELRNPEGPAHS
ncbi:hypothetical protein F511_19550 [Dorcoceras hygrometricum]|uniref:Uncharacterized protein n=1 Tax=Dorcoceras hygrometricum TaxID=472368 RepID=A0A2Z7D6K8_9LAMI|nr:hypothetical protein F511_19550 [Dorcoceras hygrometricum]